MEGNGLNTRNAARSIWVKLVKKIRLNYMMYSQWRIQDLTLGGRGLCQRGGGGRKSSESVVG